MTTPFPVVIATLLLAAVFLPPPPALALGGSAATLAVVYGSATTVCTIAAGQPIQRIQCWRNGQSLPPILPNTSFDAVAGGRDTLCGVRSGGFSLICWNTTFAPKRIYNNVSSPLTSLTIGDTQICGLRNTTSAAAAGNVICWRGDSTSSSQIPNTNSQFRTISSGLGFSCGVLQSNSRVLCWGDDFFSNSIESHFANSSMADIHVGGRHACGINNLGFVICGGDNSNGQLNVPSNSAYEYRALSLGANHSCAIRRKKIHSSVQPTITASNGPQQSSSNPPSRSSTLRRQGSILMRRQRSGPSSKHADRAEEYLFSDLATATDNFSLQNKIGSGSFGVVYKGKLPDGLRLVGYCEEKDERLLVYEFMKNGALYDHLHDKNNVQKNNSVINSWKIRIKIALDAARGIEYLHNYAVPPIIHRDIKSSNILLDANWAARVSDFGLSLMGPENDRDYRPMKAAGTVGYIDPEYYGLNVLTAKSDVYGLGVVLLELLTGKRAIFKTGENGGEPISVVEYAVPVIMAGELDRVLDPRVGPAEMNESEAVELVAYTAMHCVHLEGKDRPTMTDIVGNLERALAFCEDSHGSISSGQSIGSD
ncbi:putative serine/threonine-protein kinase-like protein ccr3 [Phtheirospermum japonicum]|uniref:non-specific serine/threonine protein kinase n=1 Tax=Phtheirospermum japonicum TaxID=374723 RepID=A0A830CRJ3_9LAMI|nr:putative serine/threonine-protein kinase-like protein ccr3 [Phtheirospermum japonicum]